MVLTMYYLGLCDQNQRLQSHCTTHKVTKLKLSLSADSWLKSMIFLSVLYKKHNIVSATDNKMCLTHVIVFDEAKSVFITLWATFYSKKSPPGRSVNYKFVQFILTSHFHKKVRATRGLVPTSQLLWWCFIQFERTIWERNDLIETPNLQGFFA